MILSDNETKVDLLNNEAIAKTIVMVLRERPDRPVTIGVHGDWGAGKSSVLEMIEASLDEQEKVLCLKFNGWRFQGFEDAKIALIEGIVTALIEKRPMLTKATDAVKNIFRRIDLLKAAKKTLIVIEKEDIKLARAANNLSGVMLKPFNYINAYDVLTHEKVVFSKQALENLLKLQKRKS